MQIPPNALIIFDGGSFTGDLPAKCKFTNGAAPDAEGNGCAVEFLNGYVMPSGSSLTLSGGSLAIDSATISGAIFAANVRLTITTSLTVSGTFSYSASWAEVSAPSLTKTGSALLDVICKRASGTTWNLSSLETVEDASVQTLTASDRVYVGQDASGTTWTTGGELIVAGNVDVQYITASDSVEISGNADGATWTTGALTFTGETFEVTSITLNGAGSFPLDYVSTVTLGEDGVLNLRDSAGLDALTLTSGAKLNFASDDPDQFLTVLTTATLGAATLLGKGYLAFPHGTDASALIQGTGASVKICECDAEVTRIDCAVSLDGTTITATPTKTDATPTILAEVKIAGVWSLIGAKISAASFTAPVQGRETWIRTFDGDRFLERSVYVDPPRAWLVYANVAAAQAVRPWIIETDYAMASEYSIAGESILLFARIAKSGTNQLLTAAQVDSIKYTCYRRKFSWGAETRTAVPGHSNVTVPINTILDSLVTNDARWTKDSTGYNWKFEPDCTTHAIFPEPGDFVIVVTIQPTSGNPAPLKFEITVN